MRGDFGMAIALLTDDSEAEEHRVVFAYGENTIGGILLLVHTPVFLNKLNGYGQSFRDIGRSGFYTVAHQPCASLGIGMDVVVSNGFEVGICKTGEAHMKRNISRMARWRLYFRSTWMILCNSSSVRKDLFLSCVACASKDVKGWTFNQPFSCAMLHQPFQGVRHG